ncbi:hypothetical protein [Candidatus Xianfuyuplasma coldseepsis]|uniref:Lipoprotein n=1 Tax=Candidatus Xianfuyuplasma coldseepsis TaxID=2782163 RepID=A0A7L7KSE5_9MOLU|nr:hypothetical protein [Xianfuyuplasma coldseepsis]QMS85136.1 hypothetical protein G4Z02_05050 [Xianfuyuplasma coldseepsis]
MKKLILLFAFVLILSACTTDDDGSKDGGRVQDTNYVTDIKTTLEGVGYVFEQRDQDAIEYYNTNAINTTYEIDVTVTDLYIGYVNETQGWLEIIEFESNDDCTTFVNAASTTDMLVYWEGNTAFITYSTDATDAFAE